MKCLLFEKTLKQLSILDRELGIIVNTCHDTAKRAETRVGFPIFFSQLQSPIEPKFHRFVILYISCDTRSVDLWTITVYRKSPMALTEAKNRRLHQAYFSVAVS